MQENENLETGADNVEDSLEKKTPEDSKSNESIEKAEEKINSAAVEEEKEEKKEKKVFKKKDKKDKKDEKIEELNDKLMRTMAEFDNFRKRTEKEKTHMFVVGAKDIVEKILPVIDNFERGLASVPEENKDSAFVQGFEQIYKQFISALEDAGVKSIDAVGQEFDPNFHNAVMHDVDENLGDNIVSEELLKGYMYRETVVRHSMVKVVN